MATSIELSRLREEDRLGRTRLVRCSCGPEKEAAVSDQERLRDEDSEREAEEQQDTEEHDVEGHKGGGHTHPIDPLGNPPA